MKYESVTRSSTSTSPSCSSSARGHGSACRSLLVELGQVLLDALDEEAEPILRDKDCRELAIVHVPRRDELDAAADVLEALKLEEEPRRALELEVEAARCVHAWWNSERTTPIDLGLHQRELTLERLAVRIAVHRHRSELRASRCRRSERLRSRASRNYDVRPSDARERRVRGSGRREAPSGS
jgi:hypothetical protein